MDERLKKLRFRAWRRGFREIDLILGPFADRRLGECPADDIEAFERLLDAPDHDVYAWIVGQAETAPEHDTPLMARLRAFRFELTTPD